MGSPFFLQVVRYVQIGYARVSKNDGSQSRDLQRAVSRANAPFSVST